MFLPEGFSYYDPFLTSDEHASVLGAISALRFSHDTFRGQQLKRSYAQFGYAYASTGRKLAPAAPFPRFITDLVARAQSRCPTNTGFNQCIITHYPPSAGIGWHTDAPVFGEVIIAISILGSARLQFRKHSAPTAELVVAPGTLYVMTGPARFEYQHQIVPVKTQRYSLTLRHVPRCLVA